MKHNKTTQGITRRLFNRSKSFAAAGFFFWLIETIVFLFIYGWHWKAIGVEVYFDEIAIFLYAISVFYWIKVVNSMIRALLIVIDEQ